MRGSIPFTPEEVTAALAALPAAQRETLWWLYEYARERRLSTAAVAGHLKRNANTIYRIFQGTYAAKLDNIISEIEAFRAVSTAREQIGRPAFIETRLACQVWEVCEAALAYQRVALIYGDGQVGKSEALQEFATRRNHGRTRYVRLPSKLSYHALLRKISAVCYLPGRGTGDQMKTDILRTLGAQSLLIVDELQQVALVKGQTAQLDILEFFKEAFDETRCSLVLCGTSESRAMMETGPLAEWLRQLRRRSLPPVVLPAAPAPTDLVTFAAHFGLAERPEGQALGLVGRVIARDGLGLFITYLQAAKKIALTLEEPTRWEHFVRAHKQFELLGQEKKAVKGTGNGNGEEGR